MSKFDKAIDELDKPEPKFIGPRTPMAKYLAEQSFFGKRYIRWKGFATKIERGQWEQLEKDYLDKTIQARILYFKDHCAPAKVVQNVITALARYWAPDNPKQEERWESMEEIE